MIEGVEELSRQTQCDSRQESTMLMLLLEGVRLGSQTTYAAPGIHI